MANNTKIEWAEASWNPVTGCTPISEGCQHCYAANMAKRFWGDRKFSDVRLHPERLDIPFKWKKQRIIFVCSMGDLFHESIPFEVIDKVFAEMDYAHWHTYVVLTKRPQRMLEYHRYCEFENTDGSGKLDTSSYEHPDHIWIGVTAENQKRADERIPILLQIPAAIHFVSVEPMLEKIDLKLKYIRPFPTEKWPHGYLEYKRQIDWVICGAETGPGARYMQRKWALDLHKQCRNAGVPFFFKKAPRGEGYKLPREFPAGR